MTWTLGFCKLNIVTLMTHFHECPLAHYCTFPTQIVGGFIQKAPKHTHYLSEFPLFLACMLPSNLDKPTRLTVTFPQKPVVPVQNILSLGPGRMNALHLKLPGVGSFQLG